MTTKGKIARQYTVQCAQCEYWEYLGGASTALDEAMVIAEEQGWKCVDGLWLCPGCEREMDRGESIDLALCKRFHPICVRLSDNLTAAYCVYDGHQPIIFEFEEIGGKKIGFGRCPKCGRIHWSMQEEDEE